MTACLIWSVCILSEICSKIVLESCFPTTPLQRFLLQFSISPETPGPPVLLCHLTSNQSFFLLTFTHSPKAFIQSDVELSGTDEGPVQGLKTLEGLLSRKSADEVVYDDLKKQHFYLELCSHQIYTSYP